MTKQNEQTDADRQELERCMRDPWYYYEKYWELGQQSCPFPPFKPEPIDSGGFGDIAFPVIRRAFAKINSETDHSVNLRKEKPRLS